MVYAVDRIENDLVICEEMETQKIESFPKKIMPLNICEGDIVLFENGEYRIDTEQTQKRKAELSKRLKGLFS